VSPTAVVERRPPVAPTGRPSRRARGRAGLPYILLAPMMLLLVVFVIAPTVLALVLMFFRWDLLEGAGGFVGADNIAAEAANGELLHGLTTTLWYGALTVPTSMAAGLVVALSINSLSRGRGFWRTVYFLPVASTLVAMSVAWRQLFAPGTGLVDATIGRLTGWSDWLGSLDLALPAVAVVGNWQQIGFVAVVYLAALGGVPRDVVEAARLDGAGRVARFRHVVWPALGPATVFSLVVSCTGALRVYDTIATMTGGGPAGATSTLTYLLWRRGIYFYDVGGAAVLTAALIALAVLITIGQLRGFGNRLERAGSR
jgi:multiple sugar transport system permease protein